MVKIETQESRNGLDLVVGPDVEFSAEGGVGEVGGLVVPCTFLVLYAAKVFCLCPGIWPDDVVVGIEYGDALVGFRVCYRGLEERESWAFGNGLLSWLSVLVMAAVKIEVHFPV